MDEGAARLARIEEAGRLWTTGRKDEGRAAYLTAWREAGEAGDDYHAGAATHMLGAIAPEGSEEQLRWHEEALARAGRLPADRSGGAGTVASWYPSLLLSLGNTLRLLGRRDEAIASCEKALAHAEALPDSDYGRGIRAPIERALSELRGTM